ncbi:MAG: MASE3 domain-containing protein, partial [Syntrophus sp. (in: bacteria)]
MKNDYLTFPKFRAAIFLVLALPVLYAISRYNYSLFHSLADGLSIVTAACVFVIIWNSRHLLDNDYFLYVGITFLFWAFLDFMHLLGNKNMGVFPAYGNLGPAFYVASRYILGISLMIAPLFINRKLNITLIFAVYSLITLLIMLSILYWQIFPVCIVDGMGLTPFKVVSDYIICLLLLGSIGLMLSKRRSFDSRVLLLILSSIILSIATGLSFTLYTDPFGIMNMIGHLFQIASFYLVYLAFIKTSLSKPQDILYRKLKLSEKALRESQQQLTDIIEFLPDATLAIDKEGRVIIWNKAIEKMTGVPAAEMIGKGDYAYTIPFYGEARPQLMDLVFDNHDEIAVKYPKITRQGSSIMAEAFCSALYNNKGAWVVAKASPLHDNSGNVIGAIESIRDITAKKQMEESLKTNLQHFQAILAHLNDGVLVLNDDNQVAFANQTFCNLFDLVVLPADILGLPALEIIKKIGEVYANPSDAVARIQEILAKGQPVYCEEVAIRGERTYMRDYVPITIDGERVGRLWQHYDITHRKQMEEALRETNAYLENLINYANAPIIVWDTQFRITRFNHAFEFLTGRSEAEVLGKSLELLFPSALTKDSMALIRKTLSGERWETVEIKILHRDESVRTVLWNSATL